MRKPRFPLHPAHWIAITLVGMSGLGSLQTANADLYENLKAFSARLDVGDPTIAAEGLNEGPKSIVADDFNRDGNPDIAVSNLDGTITVYAGQSGGEFSNPFHIATGARSLREIIAADFNQDRYLDLAVAAPFDGVVYLCFNTGRSQPNDRSLHILRPRATGRLGRSTQSGCRRLRR